MGLSAAPPPMKQDTHEIICLVAWATYVHVGWLTYIQPYRIQATPCERSAHQIWWALPAHWGLGILWSPYCAMRGRHRGNHGVGRCGGAHGGGAAAVWPMEGGRRGGAHGKEGTVARPMGGVPGGGSAWTWPKMIKYAYLLTKYCAILINRYASILANMYKSCVNICLNINKYASKLRTHLPNIFKYNQICNKYA